MIDIQKIRVASHLLEPPAADVIGEILDELQSTRAELDKLTSTLHLANNLNAEYRAELAAAKEALAEYGGHRPRCLRSWYSDTSLCDCGYDEARGEK